MPRLPRIRSRTDIYHIVLRGNNRQNIFIENEDYQRFISLLIKYKKVSGFKLYAYCLMTNHVHLLIKIEKEPIEQIMRRLCGSFVKWYNKKYGRIGYLFQDRYKSEPIEDESYLLTAARYIFQNPLKAGIISAPLCNYTWCNYSEYISNEKNTDIYFILNILSSNLEKAKLIFEEFMNKENKEVCIDIDDSLPITEKEAKKIMYDLCNIDSPSEFQKLHKVEYEIYIQQLKYKYNVSLRQIERLTGISRGIISRL